MDGKWFVNLDEDYKWDTSEEYDTKEEAMQAGKNILDEDRKLPEDDQEYYLREHFEVGQYIQYKPQVDGERVIDHIMDDAFEECGENSDIFLSNTSVENIKLLEKYLTDAFLKWADGTDNKANFGNIDNTETIHYPAYPDLK